MMYGGTSVIEMVSKDSASFNENEQRSNRSESMVGNRMTGTTEIAMRESIAKTNTKRRCDPPEIGAASRNNRP